MKFQSILLFIILVLLSSCSRVNEYVLIVDTSGSMKANNQLGIVKKSVKRILLKYNEGDRIHLLTFDSKVNFNSDYIINDNTELLKLYDMLDFIQAEGKWTNLIGALDESLKTVQTIHTKFPKRKITLILYTDGKHDLPSSHPDSSDLNFDDLFNKYYSSYDPNKPSWYIYYVELDFPDSDLKNFLDETKSGEVIESETLKASPDFLTKSVDYILISQLAGLGALLLLLLHTILFFVRPWFGNVEFICIAAKSLSPGHPTHFSLYDTKKNYFRTYLVIGSAGDIPLVGSEIDKRHAGIGVSFFGRMFIRPLRKNKIKVNGRLISKKTYVAEGSRIHIGLNEFIIQRRR